MTKSTITRERLQELAEGQSGFNLRTATHEESQELARIALAAIDSEPYGYVHQAVYEQSGSCGLSNDHEAYRDSKTHIPLYRHAQQPVVPEKCPAEIRDLIASHSDALFNDDDAQEIWNACRAAMLAAAPQPQNAQQNIPEIIPGWIPVSERMPGSQEWVIVFAKWANQQVLCWDDVQNRWTDFEDQSYYADMFSHWMPLPAAPQEVLDGK